MKKYLQTTEIFSIQEFLRLHQAKSDECKQNKTRVQISFINYNLIVMEFEKNLELKQKLYSYLNEYNIKIKEKGKGVKDK